MNRSGKGAAGRWRFPPVAPVVRFGAMGLAFLLGVIGFGQAYADAGASSSLGQNAFKAVRLIVGNFPEALDGRDLPFTLHIARWSLPLLTFWSTVALAWEQLRNPLRLMLVRARGQHLVIAGDDEGGLAAHAARSALDEGRRVVLWPRDRRATWVGDVLDAGAAEVQQGDQDSSDQLALNKARAVLLLNRDARTNIALAAAVMAQAAQVRPAGDPIDVIVRIDDLDLRRGVEGRFEQGDRSTARVRLATLPDIAARHLSLVRPIDGFVRQGSTKRHICVIGFSATVERFVLRILAGGHYRDGGKPAFFIHAPHAVTLDDAFRARNPGADTLSPVIFVEAAHDPARAAVLVDDFVADHGEPVAFLIDQADDDRALAFALAVDARYRAAALAAPPIHVRMDGHPELGLGAGIFAFGGMKDLAGGDMLLQDRHDALARSIHDFYLEGRFNDGDRIGMRASMQEWENLPESFRDDNRLVADCYQLKLRDIGARLIDGTGPTFSIEAAELEELSRAEHDRWMAAKMVQGWTYGAQRDDQQRLHPDIMPYDALSERVKDLDREQVRIMTRLLAASGQRALRSLCIVILPGGERPPPDGAALLTALAHHYPDRTPIFLGDLADPLSRRMLAALAAQGQFVQVALADHAQALIDTLPGDERRQAVHLFRTADRVHALDRGGAVAEYLRSIGTLMLTTEADEEPRAIKLGIDGAILRAPWRG